MTDQDLAAELRALSEHPGLKPRAEQLRELAAAVVTPDQAERWCEVDLFAAFPPGESVRSVVSDSSTWPKALKIIYFVQPVLVFLPILTTWSGLKEATTAYGETLATAGVEAARRPFLEMWQQGFDGRLSGWLRFDNVALWTLGAILLLIGVTLSERIMHRKIEQRTEEEAVALRSRLLAALTRATLLLAQVRLASPGRFQAELSKSAAEMHKVGETIGRIHTQVVKALEKALDATGQTTDALMAGVSEVRDSIATLDKHLIAVSSAAETLLQSVERTAYAIDSVGEKTDEAVDRVGDRLGAVILDSTTGVRKSLDELATLSGQTVRDTAASLDVRVGELVSATAGIGSAVGRMETAATESGDRISRALADTNGTLAAALGGAGAEVRDALDDWAGTASAHAARIEMVSDTAGRTALLLEETRDALNRLPNDLAQALREVPAAVREVTGPEIAALQAAIARLDEAVRQAAAAVAAGLTTGAGATSSESSVLASADNSVLTGPTDDPHDRERLNAGGTPSTAGESGERTEGRHH